MRISKFFAVAALAATAFIGGNGAFGREAATDSGRLERAMGTVLGNALNTSIERISSLGISVDRRQIVATVLDVIDGKSTGLTMAEADAIISQYVDSAVNEASRPLSTESQDAFLAAAAAEPGAIVMPSGLVFRVITEGEGPMPTDGDSVRLLYTGSLSNGAVFDSTEEPVVFTVQNLVPGFTEGLKMMKPGGTYVITFPASLGYGEKGIPGAIPGNAALQFRIELLGIIPPSANTPE